MSVDPKQYIAMEYISEADQEYTTFNVVYGFLQLFSHFFPFFHSRGYRLDLKIGRLKTADVGCHSGYTFISTFPPLPQIHGIINPTDCKSTYGSKDFSRRFLCRSVYKYTRYSILVFFLSSSSSWRDKISQERKSG